MDRSGAGTVVVAKSAAPLLSAVRALPRTCFAVSVEEDVGAEVTGPTGRQYVITASAAQPQAASDGPTGGNLIGLLQLVVRAGGEEASDRWRIVVRERTPTGDLGRTLHESSANSLEEARAMSHDLERLIRAGTEIT